MKNLSYILLLTILLVSCSDSGEEALAPGEFVSVVAGSRQTCCFEEALAPGEFVIKPNPQFGFDSRAFF